MLDRRLTYVVATARAGSFTSAAAQVGVTQSAITKSVAGIEQQLGYAIFNRTARGVIATPEGQFFIERAARLLDDAQDLLSGSLPGTDPYAVTLKIGACPPSVEWLLVEPLMTLMSRHPSIRLQIMGGTVDQIVPLLRSGAIDLAFGFEAAFLEQADFRRDPLPGVQTTLFVRKDHPLLDKSEVTLEDMAKYDMVSPSDSQPYSVFMRSIYENAGLDARRKLHFIDYFPIVMRIVATTDALAFTSLRYSETQTFKRRFERLSFLNATDLPPLCIASRSRPSPRPAARAFVKACREHMGSYSDTTAGEL